MKRFLEWQKAIFIFSTVLTLILTTVGFLLSPFAASHVGIEPPKAREILHLTVSGWVGWFAIGTIINIFAALITWLSNSLKKSKE